MLVWAEMCVRNDLYKSNDSVGAVTVQSMAPTLAASIVYYSNDLYSLDNLQLFFHFDI